jgi:hypothetical protein
MLPPIRASISRKSSYKVPIIIFRCYTMGDEPIVIEQLFSYGFEGVFMGLIMGSQNIMGSDYGSNISDSLDPAHAVQGRPKPSASNKINK